MDKTFPRPQVAIGSQVVASLRDSMTEDLRRHRFVILQVSQGDRHEATAFLDEMFTHGRHRIITTTWELSDQLHDPIPDPCVITFGDDVPLLLQSEFVARHANGLIIPSCMVLMTETDPGDLLATRRMIMAFRGMFFRTFAWPKVTDRPKADLMKLLIAFAGQIKPDIKFRKGAAELYVQKRLELRDGDQPNDIVPFTNVGQLYQAAEMLIRLAEKNGEREVTSSLLLDATEPGWRASLPYHHSNRPPAEAGEAIGDST